MYPLFLKPVIKDYLWGGKKLKTEYNKQSDSDILAESWELSCHKDGLSIIDNGSLSGKSLYEYVISNTEKILGTKCSKFDYFPILVKLIDAKENLSIQVHPNNDYALKNEGQYGKTEMWYIIDCKPDSFIYFGFNKDLSKNEFIERIKSNNLLNVLNAVKVKKGDVFFIESGTLHAICGGILLAEVQQNSNITYRIYDYNRIGTDGKPRNLHINKAVDVTNFKMQKKQSLIYKSEGNKNYTKQMLSKCEYFTSHIIMIYNKVDFIADSETFHCMLCLNGSLNIIHNYIIYSFNKGQTVFIPANLGNYTIEGKGELLFINL